MEIEFLCQSCGKRNQCEVEIDAIVACAFCGKQYEEVSEFSDAAEGLKYCGICKCRDLYIQKDFNRKIGIAIACIGAILAPFTKLISLFVCALIDLILYKVLPMISICYRCQSIYRGFAPNSLHQGFNLGVNDRYRAAER